MTARSTCKAPLQKAVVMSAVSLELGRAMH